MAQGKGDLQVHDTIAMCTCGNCLENETLSSVQIPPILPESRLFCTFELHQIANNSCKIVWG